MNILTFLGQSPIVISLTLTFIIMAVGLLVAATYIKDKTSKIIPTMLGVVLIAFPIVMFLLLSHQIVNENNTQTASIDTVSYTHLTLPTKA